MGDNSVTPLLRSGLRALSDGRAHEAVSALAAAVDNLPSGSAAHAIALRYLAEARLAAGDFGEGLACARRARDEHLVCGLRGKRLVEAWTTLGLSASLANIDETGPNPFQEAAKAAAAGTAAGALYLARMQRLAAREPSAAGDLSSAEVALKELSWLSASPTRAARREALHVETELAILAIRRADFDSAIARFLDIAEQRGALLGADHPERLTALHNAAVALRRITRRQDALDLFADVSARRSAVLGADHPDTLVTRSFLCVQRAEGGAADAQREQILEILQTARHRLGDRHVFTLQIAGRVANVLDIAGQVHEALAVLGEWAQRARDTLGASHPEVESLLHEFGSALRNAGQLGKAYAIFSELAEATRVAKGEAHLDTLATYNNLAVVADDLGLDEEAEAILRAMLTIFARLGESQALNEASVRNNLAQLLLTRGRGADARDQFERVLATRTARLEPGHRLLHLSRSNLAAALAREHRFAEAEALHRTVLNERTERYGADHPDRLASLHNLASTLSESGRPAEASPLLQEVFDKRRILLGDTHPTTVISGRALAGALRACGKDDEAEALYRQIVSAVERVRRDGALTEDARRTLFASYVPAYRELAILAAQRGDAEGVFTIAEKIKARTLLERVSSRPQLSARAQPEEEAARWRDLEQQIAEAEAHVASAVDPVAGNAARVSRDRLIKQRQQIEASMAEASPTLALENDAHLLGIETARAALDDDETFLSFVAQDDHVVVAWVSREECGCADLGAIRALSGSLAAFKAVISHPGGLAGLEAGSSQRRGMTVWGLPTGGYRLAPRDRPPMTGARRLHDETSIETMLSKRLVEALPQQALHSTRLLISPDGPLAALPFEVLARNGHRLLETHEVAYATSLSLMIRLPARRAGEAVRTPLIAIGDPSFPSQSSAEHASAPVASASPLAAARGSGDWAELPGARRELAAVAAQYGLVRGKTLFTRETASLEIVRGLATSGALSRADVVLFSTHGWLDQKDTRRSALVLSGDSNDPGLLAASEISSYELSADLVFLSACDTGAAPFQSGEGVLGLPFAFYVAGAKASIQTLWPIYDEPSAVFVKLFFETYRFGTPASRALTATKRALANGSEGGELSSPAYWAGFAYYGR